LGPKVNDAASSPISDSNIAYVFHFYAAEHTRTYFESNVNAALSANLPVFVTEYGTVMADGDGTHSTANTDAWHTYMDNKMISSCAWSVNDKEEAAAFFGTGSTFNMKDWTNQNSMTPSGKYIFNKLRTYANSAPWRKGSVVVTPSSSSASGGGSNTRCKDDYGRDYFCQWGTGCFAADPAYDPDGYTCPQIIDNCILNGTLFVNSSVEGEGKRCNNGSNTVSSSSATTAKKFKQWRQQ